MAASPEAALFQENDLERFWRLREPLAAEAWSGAVRAALDVLPEASRHDEELDGMMHRILGEAQFGEDHWQLTVGKRAYYAVKPIVPRFVARAMRRLQLRNTLRTFALAWPVEDRYALFLAEAIRHLLLLTGKTDLEFVHFWPADKAYAFVLTHDIETEEGQTHALEVAELDARFGFRSCFNFVPRRYRVDGGIMAELKARGFEVGVHDYNHDGKLFASKETFSQRARLINEYANAIGARGFRAALTHRNPSWMQELEIAYDLSFFDTDPFEPIAGGTMSVWPFWIGRFLELPYTLVQDYTLTRVLKEKTPAIWLEKIEYVSSRCGMALLNSHPDYLGARLDRHIYTEFLDRMAQRGDFWHALPGDVYDWWCDRQRAARARDLPGAVEAHIGPGGWESVTRVTTPPEAAHQHGAGTPELEPQGPENHSPVVG